MLPLKCFKLIAKRKLYLQQIRIMMKSLNSNWLHREILIKWYHKIQETLAKKFKRRTLILNRTDKILIEELLNGLTDSAFFEDSFKGKILIIYLLIYFLICFFTLYSNLKVSYRSKKLSIWSYKTYVQLLWWHQGEWLTHFITPYETKLN